MLSGTEWFRDHMENFVKPGNGGKIPNITMGESYVSLIDDRHRIALHAMWKEAKRRAGMRIILLPGRDVWWFEVLARLEGWPTVFKPEFSSNLKQAVDNGYDVSAYKDMYAVDTGYRGSVPKALKCDSWACMSYSPDPSPEISKLQAEISRKLSANGYKYDAKLQAAKDHLEKIKKEYYGPSRAEHMLFPRRTALSPMANLPSWMEGSPKYWPRGEWNPTTKTMTQGKPGANAYDVAFERAAIVTQHIVGVEYNTGRTVKEYYDKPKPVKVVVPAPKPSIPTVIINANLHPGGRNPQVPTQPAQGSAQFPPIDLGNFMPGGVEAVQASVRATAARPRHGRKLRVSARVPKHRVPVPEGTFGGFVNTEHSKSNSPYPAPGLGAAINYSFTTAQHIFFKSGGYWWDEWSRSDTNAPALPQPSGKKTDEGDSH